MGSRRCAEKVWRKNHDLHRSKVSNSRSVVDVSAPAITNMEHLRNNLKKERLLEDRYVEIDRENKVLLNKISEVMRQPSIFSEAPSEKSSKVPACLSNRSGRKAELSRITMENARLLKAIRQTQPVYSAKKWEDNFKKSEVLLRNCSSYPVITRLPRVRSEPSVLRQIPPELAEDTADPRGSLAHDDDAQDQKVMLKEGKTIGKVYYLIEMATDGRVLNVSAYNGETQTSLELVVNEKKHRRLYRECDGDYSRISERLRIEGNRLILDSPGTD